MKYIPTIGLEIHVAISSEKKLFSQTKADFEVKEFSLFDCATPGVLPVLNYEPVYMACAFGFSTKADVKSYSIFERKHYFYPDLALGYQITQQYNPIILGGVVPIVVDGIQKEVIIEHAHLECDAAKSIHDDYLGVTKIDISRGSSALLEIVSTPCMHSPQEAKEYAKAVHSLVTFLDICDGKMQEGSFRVDASISLHTEEGKLGTRVEIKNISSFAFLEKALEYEIIRQEELLESGKKVIMETRLYDETTDTTKSMRDKETVGEYRYMPDPDIPNLILEKQELDDVKNKYFLDYFSLKTFLEEKIDVLDLGITKDQLSILLSDKYMQKYLIDLYLIKSDDKELYKCMIYTIYDVYKKEKVIKKISLEDLQIFLSWGLGAKELKESLTKYLTQEISIIDCKPVFEDNTVIDQIIKDVLSQFPQEIEKFKNGQEKILQFLIGKCMAQLKGKAQAATVKEKVLKIIG